MHVFRNTGASGITVIQIYTDFYGDIFPNYRLIFNFVLLNMKDSALPTSLQNLNVTHLFYFPRSLLISHYELQGLNKFLTFWWTGAWTRNVSYVHSFLKLWRRIFMLLSQLLVAVDNLWLIAISLQTLPVPSHDFPSVSLCLLFVEFVRTLVIQLSVGSKSVWSHLDIFSLIIPAMCSHSLLEEIFLTQVSNSGLLLGRQILRHLSHRRKPNYTFQIRSYSQLTGVKIWAHLIGNTM